LQFAASAVINVFSGGPVANNTPPSYIFLGALARGKMLTVNVQRKRHASLGDQVLLGEALAESVVAALSDDLSRRIVSSTVEAGKTVQEMSTERRVPLSSCYRRVHELVDQGLLVIERIVITGDGKRYAVYRSSFRTIKISSNLELLSATAELNPEVAEKFSRKWLTHGAALGERLGSRTP
jgi:hypothetical protein